ncbi:MAG: hypothetical protein AAF901_01570 [Bacteroidota bacterium]
MELVVTTQDLDPLPEPLMVHDFATEGLLNSNYKTVVDDSYSNASTKTVFGMRQGLKFSRFSTVNYVGVILKLSVFAGALAFII